MTSSPDPERLVGRSYTKARRHPLVVGRFPGGGALWGGPYTIPQLIAMAVSFAVLVFTRQLWAHLGLVGNLLVLAGVPAGLGFALRRAQVDGRNPLAAAGSALLLLGTPRGGRLGGRAVQRRRAHAVMGLCTVGVYPPHRAAAVPAGNTAGGISTASMGEVSVVSSVRALLAERRREADARARQGE